AGAEVRAEIHARANLKRALAEAVEPVPCPRCGMIQPNMVEVLRQRYGRGYEPNKYAAERIAIPVATAWRSACEANSVESYSKFMKVWPTHRFDAERRIRDLKYKAVAPYFWVVWAALVLFIAYFVAATVFHY